MLNRITKARIDALAAQYQQIAARFPEAIAQITLAELAESVQQSNEIENSTLSIIDTERILEGKLPSRHHDLPRSPSDHRSGQKPRTRLLPAPLEVRAHRDSRRHDSAARAPSARIPAQANRSD